MADINTYVYDAADEIIAVKCNGTSFTQRSSIADVESNGNSFYWDRGTSKLYAAGNADETLFGKSIIAVSKIDLATKEKVFSNVYYDPRITSVPKLSMRIEETFGGVGQISIGSLSVANADGAFDSRANYLWNNADTKVTLKLGYDTATEDMAYGSYANFGVWGVEDWEVGDMEARLSLKERKARLDVDVPLERFDSTTYPNLDADDVGEPIPRAYGAIYGARPILIDESTKTFKVANHAIKSLDEIRLLIDEVWTTSSFTTKDLDNGEFTCDGWQDGYEVSVDFNGRKNDDGSLMNNAADIVEDLLEYVGITAAEIDSTAKTAAYNSLDFGLNSDDTRKTARAISLYLDGSQKLVDVISKINAAVGSFLFVDASGKFHFKVFEPVVGEGLTIYDETDCLAFLPQVEKGDTASKVFLRYAHRREDDWWRLTTQERTANQYELPVVSAEVLDKEIEEISAKDDAEYWAQRYLVSDGRPRKLYKVSLPAKAMALLPGDQIHVKNTRRTFDEILECLSIEIDWGQGMVRLLCGDLRGWGRDSGHWVADADTLPTRFANLAGYGSGSLAWNASWDDEIKAWARQNVGYWTDANGFANSSDPDSLISTWF